MDTSATNVTVIDSIMGSGKSTYAIQHMNNTEGRFVYITPFLSEVERIKQSVKNKTFYEPKQLGNGKLDSLKNLLKKGRNIASTHALFSLADDEVINLIKDNNYTLILDEVIEVVNPIPITMIDIKALVDIGAIAIGDDNVVNWVDNHYYTEGGLLDFPRRLILNKRVLCVDGTYFLWEIPIEVFKNFKEVFVLTYKFSGQIMRHYFDMYDVNYEYKSVNLEDGIAKLIPLTDDKAKLKGLIHIVDDDKLNAIGDNDFSLSKKWYELSLNIPFIKIIKNNLLNYFRNKMKAKKKEILWTAYKDYANKLKSKGFASDSCFAPCNARATNEYRDRTILAYTVNRFIHPFIKKYFKYSDIVIDENEFALAEMLQWIFRSAIRDNKEITIYIPSKRMRTLLQDWINN